MNLKTILLTITLCNIFSSCSQKENEPDFRSTNWGMSKDQVKLVENARLIIDGAKMLSYDGTVNGQPCQIVYLFVKDQLVGCHYFFKIDYSNNISYINDYRTLKETVSEKYSRPVLDETTWKNDQYKNDAEKIGIAVRLGHVAFATQWTTPKTDIWLFLVSENGTIKLSMKYTSKKLASLRDEETKIEMGDSTKNPNEF